MYLLQYAQLDPEKKSSFKINA